MSACICPPPAVFAQIQLLGRELGEKLYKRTGRKLLLTPAGRLMIGYCRRLTRVHDDALGAVKELSGMRRSPHYLGCGPHISVSIVPHLLRVFLPNHSSVELRPVTGTALRRVVRGQGGRDFHEPPGRGRELDPISLVAYEMVFAIPPHDPIAGHRKATVRELARHPFILYQRARVMETAISQFCLSVGFKPKILMQNDQADSIKELVKLGLGIALLPLWSVSEDARRSALATVRLAKQRLFRTTGLVYRKSGVLPPALHSAAGCSASMEDMAAAPGRRPGVVKPKKGR